MSTLLLMSEEEFENASMDERRQYFRAYLAKISEESLKLREDLLTNQIIGSQMLQDMASTSVESILGDIHKIRARLLHDRLR